MASGEGEAGAAGAPMQRERAPHSASAFASKQYSEGEDGEEAHSPRNSQGQGKLMPFEAWHFQRSAVLHHVVLIAIVAFYVIFLYAGSDAGSLSVFDGLFLVCSLVMLSGRAAAHAWLEPVFAQVLVSRLAFGILAAINLYSVWDAVASASKEELQSIALHSSLCLFIGSINKFPLGAKSQRNHNEMI